MQDNPHNSVLRRNRWLLYGGAAVIVLLIWAAAIIFFADLEQPYWGFGVAFIVLMIVLGVRRISRIMERKV